GKIRLSVGAVNVRTGNFVYFDNETHTIRPEHVMASGSIPPGFPAVEIEGKFYWMGAFFSTTPLKGWAGQVPPQVPRPFKWDLGSGHGELPSNLADVDAPEGNTILEPHARQHRSVQAVPARPKNARESSLETTSRPPGQRGSEDPEFDCRRQGLQPRPS